MSLAPPSPSPLVPGYQLDRYELLCPIAEGGMAQVWIARLRGKHGFERLVAIKTILPKFASDTHFQQMFLDEARIASAIQHNNVAHIVDLGDEHGVLYLAMEWVDGDALTKIHRALEKKSLPIPPGVLLRILADTCAGLHAAHELRGRNGEPLGVVHRDVSPQNVLVNTRGVAKLIDFGIAKARDRLSGDTNTGFLKGKVHYMAPEQALGSTIDRRADVWAIGAILYHYLSGEQPFDGPNQLATLHALTSGKPPKPLPERVPAAVAAVTMRALSHDLEKRFPSAAAMQTALEEAMTSSNLATTTADVAAFCQLHMADRAANRKEAIDIALAAAEERARVHSLFKPDAESSSSIPNVSARLKAARAALDEDDSGRPPTVRAGRGSSPDVDPADLDVKIPLPPSVPTNATLARAAVSTRISLVPRTRRGAWTIGAVGVVGVALGVTVMLLFRGGAAPASVAAPPPSPSTTSVAVATTVSVPPVPSAPDPTPSATAPPLPPSSAAPPTTRAARPAPVRPSPPKKIPQVIPNGF